MNDYYSPGCQLSESAWWSLIIFKCFLKMSKIQDGRQRPFENKLTKYVIITIM